MVVLSCCSVTLNHSLLLKLQISHYKQSLLEIPLKVCKPSYHQRGLENSSTSQVIPLPLGITSKPEIAFVSTCDCFGNSTEKHTQALSSQEQNQAKCRVPACFQVLQAE